MVNKYVYIIIITRQKLLLGYLLKMINNQVIKLPDNIVCFTDTLRQQALPASSVRQKQEAQLSDTGNAMLHVIGNFVQSCTIALVHLKSYH